MKKILLSVLSCLSIATLSFAQSFTTIYGDTASVAGGGDIKVINSVINTSSSTSTYEWKITNNDFPTGWNFGGMCDNNLCYYNISGTTRTSNPVDAGDTMYHYVDFKDEGAAMGSSAFVTSTISVAGAPLSAKDITFIATKTTSSTITITRSEDNIVVFPNPAKSSVNVIYDANLGVKNIGIYNLIGKMVSVYKVSSTSAKLDVEDLPSGIYFVRLYNSQGKVVGTRKFTHQ